MRQQRPAVHRTIIIVDVEGFGDRRRTNENQVAVREGLYRAMQRAFGESNIPWAACHCEDRGDAILVLAPPVIPKARFVGSLPHELVKALRKHNGMRAAEERIRLRMAVHAGEINYDDYGVAAQAINLTFRLLDAHSLKVALADSPGVLALIASSWFFDEVVRQGSKNDSATYRPVWVAVKETSTLGWICLPDHPYPPDEALVSSVNLVTPRSVQSSIGMVGLPAVVPAGRLPVAVRGRERLLRELRRSLRKRSGASVILAGMGGVGKSTVAAEFADRVQRAFARWRRPLVWWVPAADRDVLTGTLLTVARQIGATDADINAIGANTPDAPDRFWRLLHRVRRNWLLIFDNADEPTMLGRLAHDARGDGLSETATGSVADGTGWLRATRRGMVLVTTRHSCPDVWGRHARVIHVEPLEERDAAQVLLDRAPMAGDDAEARELARRLGGLPLALRLVGSYLRSDLTLCASFRDYRHALDDHGTRAPLLTSVSPKDSVGNARAVVMSTWELSLDALDQRGVPQARPLLRLLSCYAWATPIPLWLLAPERLSRFLAPDALPERSPAAANPRYRLEHGLSQLKMLGLIDVRVFEANQAERGLVVHPVVADTNRSHLLHDQDGKVDATLVCHTAVELAVGALEHLDHEQATHWAPYLTMGPHLSALLQVVTPYLDRAHLDNLITTVTMAARAHNLSGAVPASERLLRAALDAVASLPDDDLIRLTVLHELAWPVASQGRSEEAETLYHYVLAARLEILGDEHPETLRTRHELAWVTAVQGRWAEAEKAYREILDIRRHLFGDEDPETLMTHHELGWAIARQSRGTEAEPILVQVFDARRRLLGEQHPRTLKSLHELAWVTASQGRWAEAEAQYRALLDRGRPVLGSEHLDMLTFRHELAWVLAEQGNHRAALTEYQIVLDARLRVLCPQHLDTIATRQSIERLHHGEVTPAHHWA